MILTEEQIRALVEGVWSGQYDHLKLPDWLFAILADGLEGAVVEGWGNPLGSGAITDIALELSMKENTYYFAAHKTAHELKDMNNILTASKGKIDFVKRALAVNDKYNKNWYETEYNVAKRLAKAGREWKRIEETQTLYPYLEYRAVNDENTRASHAALNGIIRPVGDPFWDTYFPPLDWNCRCRAIRRMEGKLTDLDGVKLVEVDPQFSERVTDSKRIWHESHPYFSGLSKAEKKRADGLAEKKYKEATE